MGPRAAHALEQRVNTGSGQPLRLPRPPKWIKPRKCKCSEPRQKLVCILVLGCLSASQWEDTGVQPLVGERKIHNLGKQIVHFFKKRGTPTHTVLFDIWSSKAK